MGEAVPPLPQYSFMAGAQGEHKDNFTGFISPTEICNKFGLSEFVF
jgi:hypothetical protein